MYRLQYAVAFDKNGNNIPATDLEWKDTVFEYEDEQDAYEDRIMMQMQSNNKYIRVAFFE